MCVPQPIKDSLFRGSCTCNIPTEKAYGAAEAAFQAIERQEVSHALSSAPACVLRTSPPMLCIWWTHLML